MALDTYGLWRRLSPLPGGSRVFSAGVCLRAPYFATVLPHVSTLRPGYCEVRAPKWVGVHNHLGTFHAIAACNLAEVAMGMLAEATVPRSHRWIPKGMRVDYLTKATTALRAVAALDPVPEFTDSRELEIPVSLQDASGTEVVHAVITVWVTPRAASA
jgi:acyl-coenzyme A thioesterase PaaI-like protein